MNFKSRVFLFSMAGVIGLLSLGYFAFASNLGGLFSTPTPTPTFTPTITSTPTNTDIFTATASLTPTDTLTPTNTLIPTPTDTPTPTFTSTRTPRPFIFFTLTPTWKPADEPEPCPTLCELPPSPLPEEP